MSDGLNNELSPQPLVTPRDLHTSVHYSAAPKSRASSYVDPAVVPQRTFQTINDTQDMIEDQRYDSLAAVAAHVLNNSNPGESRSIWQTLKWQCMIHNCRGVQLEAEVNTTPIQDLFGSSSVFAQQLIWAIAPILSLMTPSGQFAQSNSPMVKTPQTAVSTSKDRIYLLFSLYQKLLCPGSATDATTDDNWGDILPSVRKNAFSSSSTPTPQTAHQVLEANLFALLESQKLAEHIVVGRVESVVRLFVSVLLMSSGGALGVKKDPSAAIHIINTAKAIHPSLARSAVLADALVRAQLACGQFAEAQQNIKSLANFPAVHQILTGTLVTASQANNPSSPAGTHPSVDAARVFKELMETAGPASKPIAACNTAVASLHALELTEAYLAVQDPLWQPQVTKHFSFLPHCVKTLGSLYEFSANRADALGALRDLLKTSVPENKAAAQWAHV